MASCCASATEYRFARKVEAGNGGDGDSEVARVVVGAVTTYCGFEGCCMVEEGREVLESVSFNVDVVAEGTVGLSIFCSATSTSSSAYVLDNMGAPIDFLTLLASCDVRAESVNSLNCSAYRA